MTGETISDGSVFDSIPQIKKNFGFYTDESGQRVEREEIFYPFFCFHSTVCEDIPEVTTFRKIHWNKHGTCWVQEQVFYPMVVTPRKSFVTQ